MKRRWQDGQWPTLSPSSLAWVGGAKRAGSGILPPSWVEPTSPCRGPGARPGRAKCQPRALDLDPGREVAAGFQNLGRGWPWGQVRGRGGPGLLGLLWLQILDPQRGEGQGLAAHPDGAPDGSPPPPLWAYQPPEN